MVINGTSEIEWIAELQEPFIKYDQIICIEMMSC